MPVQAPALSENPTEGSKVLKDAPSLGGKNGIDEVLTKAFIQEIEDEKAAIADIDLNARKAKQPHIDAIKDIYKRAAEKGISKAPLRVAIGERGDLRRAETRRNSLNENEQALLDQIKIHSASMPLWNDLEEADEKE